MFKQMVELFKTKLKGNNTSTVTVNGQTFTSTGDVVVLGNGTTRQVIIDGNVVHNSDSRKLEISIVGDCEDVSTTSGNINITGNSGDISTTSGDVIVRNNSGKVSTTSGDVTARTITGTVKTVSGDINV